ncbi:hypothetical protein GALL_460590 [mine drainage metagenome]|uniref:Uncharacterized protein n=1 Tax=mine drainage metagenome TaxID=410659 RepID=A0A1J5Q8M7_9ZZZZ
MKCGRVPGVIDRLDSDHQSGIGIAFIARILAHAVGHDPADFTGCGHHGAARTHAKTVHRTAIAGVMHQLVSRCTQQRVAGVAAPQGAVDHALRMFDAKAHRKRLGPQAHPPFMQHGKGIACAVAQGQHAVVGAQRIRLAAGLVEHAESAQLPGTRGTVNFDVNDTLLKANFAAQGNDLFAQVLYHPHQPEGANVRVSFDQNLWRRTGLDQLLHDLAPQMLRVPDLAPQLAIREGAGTAFAKLDVPPGIEDTLAPQAPGVLRAFTHFFTALKHNGLETHLRQQQRSKHAARAKTDHHRGQHQAGAGPQRRDASRLRGGCDMRVGRFVLQHLRLKRRIDQRHIHAIDRTQLSLAGIKTAPENLQFTEFRLGQIQCFGRQLTQCGNGMRCRCAVSFGFCRCIAGTPGRPRQRRQRKFQFKESDHAKGWLVFIGQMPMIMRPFSDACPGGLL